MTKNFFKSKYFVFCLILLLVLVSIAMTKEAYRYYKVGQEIRDLENKIRDLKKSNEELAQEKEYFTSKEFLEDEARKKLNMVKEGESVIVISSQSAPEENKSQEQKPKISNIKFWLEYFFAKR
jgi:cell division protein FtsL